MSSMRQFRSFIATARLGSFAAAGQQVGLSAAAVGLQIRALEHDLNRTLFDRSGRSIVLNTAGRALLGPVHALVEGYEGLAARDQGGSLSGTLVMGALVSALMGAFADCLWSLKREHPLLELNLLSGQSADFAQRVQRGELDAAVVTRPPVALPGKLSWSLLYTEPMVLIVPRKPHFTLPDDPLHMLSSCPFMRFDRQAWTGHLVDQALKRCGVAVREGMELNSVEAIVALVRQGFGVSIVPQLANLQWARDRALRIVHLPQVDVVRQVGLLERPQHSRKRVTAVIKSYFDKQG